MDLTPYVETLRQELAVAAEAGGPDARSLAERLSAPLESATRLVLLEALSAAADEITRDVAPSSVEVRLRGRDPELVVTGPPADEMAAEEAPDGSVRAALARAIEVTMGVRPPATGVSGPGETADPGATSRITLRLSEDLKGRIDEAANRAGLSVNAWLVRVVSASLEPTPGRPRSSERTTGAQFGRRYTGWAR